MPDNKLSIICTQNHCQATFLGSLPRSQKLCLTGYMSIVMGSKLSGTIFWIPEIMPDDCQATFLGSSGIIFGISRLFLGYKKKPKQGNQGCFREFKGVFVPSYANLCYISQHSYHVNHPFKLDMCQHLPGHIFAYYQIENDTCHLLLV